MDMNSLNKSQNIFSRRLSELDLFRVILMLLGFVFHTFIMYKVLMTFHQQTQFLALIMHEGQIDRWAWSFMVWIHLYRMPAFFMLAGFFAHFLLQRYRYLGFIRNRVKRIVVPLFVVLVIINIPSIVIIAKSFLANTSMPAINIKMGVESFTWFLVFLFYMELFFLVLMLLCTRLLKHRDYAWLWLLLFFILLSTGVLVIQSGWFFSVPFEVNRNATVLDCVFYSAFFFAGALLFNAQVFSYLRNKKLMWLLMMISICAAALYFNLMHFQSSVHIFLVASVLHSMIAWSFSFGLLMLCAVYGNKANRVIRYLSGASYFLYLIQVPMILLFINMCSAVSLFWLRYLLVLGLSFIFSVALYHFCVRQRRWLAYIDGAKRR
jgi:glucans biosynthesis protein C